MLNDTRCNSSKIRTENNSVDLPTSNRYTILLRCEKLSSIIMKDLAKGKMAEIINAIGTQKREKKISWDYEVKG